MTQETAKQLKVTLVRSLAKKRQSHRDCVRGLGLKKMHHSRVVDNTPENRGMINKVSYMLKVEDA